MGTPSQPSQTTIVRNQSKIQIVSDKGVVKVPLTWRIVDIITQGSILLLNKTNMIFPDITNLPPRSQSPQV